MAYGGFVKTGPPTDVMPGSRVLGGGGGAGAAGAGAVAPAFCQSGAMSMAGLAADAAVLPDLLEAHPPARSERINVALSKTPRQPFCVFIIV